MITDRQKFTTNIPLYGMCSFYFYHWNQLKIIPLGYMLHGRIVLSNFYDTSAAGVYSDYGVSIHS